MTLADIASIGGLCSGIAVLVSVLLLYFQLRQLTEQVRQSERNQQALIRQGKTDRIVSIFLKGTEPSLAAVTSKIGMPAKDISPTEYAQYHAYMSAIFAAFEDIFYQHKDGLITDSAYAAPNLGFSRMMSSEPAREIWASVRTTYPDEFVAFVDDLAASSPAGDSRS